MEQLQQAAQITSSLSGLMDAITALLTSAVSFIGVASVIAKYLPPPENPGFLSLIHKWINALAMNSGYAENKNQ